MARLLLNALRSVPELVWAALLLIAARLRADGDERARRHAPARAAYAALGEGAFQAGAMPDRTMAIGMVVAVVQGV